MYSQQTHCHHLGNIHVYGTDELDPNHLWNNIPRLTSEQEDRNKFPENDDNDDDDVLRKDLYHLLG